MSTLATRYGGGSWPTNGSDGTTRSASVDALTRSEVCRRLLADDGAGLLKGLGGKFQVDLLGFGREVWDVPAERGDDLFTKSASSQVDFTDLGMPLRRALELAGPGRGEVRGVLLLTDGRHNRGPLPADEAARLGEHKVPVYPIALGTRQPGPDLAIVGLEAPNAVFKEAEAGRHTNVTVKATLQVRGLSAQEIVVELRSGGRVLDQKHVVHDGKDRDYPLAFAAGLAEEGTQKLTVTVRPVAGQMHPENASRSALVKVVEDQAEVLLIDGEARWEHHYLAAALGRDPMVRRPRCVVFVQPRLGRIEEDELRKLNHPALALPTEPDALAPYDCVVLGDVSPEQLQPAERARLEKYVGERGGLLVIVAGKRFMPLAFSGAKRQAEQSDPLLKLLPITEPRVVAPRVGFPITLTDEGKRTPLMRLSDEPGDHWADLPPHYWGVVGRKKPAASCLAYYTDGQSNGKKAEEEQALIAWQQYGRGRVLFVGLDSTWRWRGLSELGDKYHHRFWGQLVRWSATDKLLEGGTSQVRYGAVRAMYQSGEDIDLRLRLGDDLPADLPKGPARARIVPQGGREAVAVVPLRRRDGQPRVLEGKMRDLPPGQYRIDLDVPDLSDRLAPPTAPGAPAPRPAEFLVTPPEGREMLELTTDWDLLKALADQSGSGGRVYAPEEAAQLLAVLTRQESVREERTESRLWEWWPTLAAVLLLLTAEWVVRKWAGLP